MKLTSRLLNLREKMSVLSYKEAIDRLNTLQSNASVVEAVRLNRSEMNQKSIPEMVQFWNRMGYAVSDLERLRVIHIAGTKGKGSTAAFVDSLLSSYDESPERIKTGVYTSPHLISVRERIRIGGRSLSEDVFVTRFNEVWALLKGRGPDHNLVMPTYFRFLTLLALHTFLKERVNVAIVEAGVGGEYDATNFVESTTVCGISALGFDHQNILGDTIESIAWNKAGIWKKGAVAIASLPNKPEVLQTLRERARERDVASFSTVAVNGGLSSSMIGLSGDFQLANASLALEIVAAWLQLAKGYAFHPQANVACWPHFIKAGLLEAYWPGRAQIIEQQVPKQSHLRVSWHLDGAHTLESMEICADWFGKSTSSSKRPKLVVFSCTGNRDYIALIKALNCLNQKKVIFCSTQLKEASSDSLNKKLNSKVVCELPSTLASHFLSQEADQLDCVAVSDATDAYNFVQNFAVENGSPLDVLVTGSIHLVGAMLEQLSYPIR